MATDQQFTLRWNNYTNNLLQVFMEQLKCESMVDCTLSAQGQFLKAHKMVLSACSPYFQDLFKNHQNSNPVIIFNGINFLDLKLVVEFMYQGEIKVLEGELEGLLAAAESLQVKGLSNVRNKMDVQESPVVAPVPVPQPSKLLDPGRKSGSPMVLRRKRRRTTNSLSSCCTNSECSKETHISSECKSSKSTTVMPVTTCFTDSYSFSSVKVKTEPPDFVDVADLGSVKNDNDDDEEEGDIAGWESSKSVLDEKVEQSSAANLKSKNKISRNMKKKVDTKPYSTRGKLLRSKRSSSGDTSREAGRGREEKAHMMEWLDQNGSKIPRPPNAFMVFANEWRSKLASKYPEDTNKEISVRLGIMWKNLAAPTKEGYYKSARLADEEHKRKYPGYYYSPKEARMRKVMRYDNRRSGIKLETKPQRAVISSVGRAGRWKSVVTRSDNKEKLATHSRQDEPAAEGIPAEQGVEGEESLDPGTSSNAIATAPDK